MPGRTPLDAVNAYYEPLQKGVALISKGVLQKSNSNKLDETGILNLADPVPLNGCRDLFLGFTQQYRIIKDAENGPYKITTLGYMYTLETATAEEIIGYHWHPDGQGTVKYAHLHLGPAAQIGRAELIKKAHIPTSRVAFEDVVKLAVEVFGARPDRKAWETVIETSKAAFQRYKRW